MIKTKYRGKPVPFGAIATLEGDTTNNTGIVDDAGILYLSGLPQQGNIAINWGKGQQQHCRIIYQLNDLQMKSAISRITTECQ